HRSKDGSSLTKIQRFPQAKGIVPRIGTIQWMLGLAVHPYQKSPMVTPNPPIIAEYKRCSGAICVFPSWIALSCLLRYKKKSHIAAVGTDAMTPITTPKKAKPV